MSNTILLLLIFILVFGSVQPYQTPRVNSQLSVQNESFSPNSDYIVILNEIPDKLDFLDSHSKVIAPNDQLNQITNNEQQKSDGGRFSVNKILTKENLSKIVIENTPGAVITNLLFDNQVIELINSPNSTISNNIITNLSSDTRIAAISIINSSNTVISSNLIHSGISNQGGIIAINANNSNNLVIQDNIIYSLEARSRLNFSADALGILISSSSSVQLTNNNISQIIGGSSAGIMLDRVESGEVNFNTIKDLSTLKIDRSEVFGILVVNSTNNVISKNRVSNLLANNLMTRSLAFGISIADSNQTEVHDNLILNIQAIADRPDSFGIHLSSSYSAIIHNNSIREIYTKSDIDRRAFSTGIYMSHSGQLELYQNLINLIIVEGRASYGIYADFSDGINIIQNTIFDLSSTFRYQNNADAIIIRESDNLLITKNLISDVNSITNNQDFDLQIPSAIGILLDVITNITVSQNLVTNVESVGNLLPTDSIGILISTSIDVLVYNNSINQINSFKFDSYAIGIAIHSSTNLEILENQVSYVHANSNTILVLQSFSKNIISSKNQLILEKASDSQIGLYSIKNFNETIVNNIIAISQNKVGVGILISFTENFSVKNNALQDFTNNSVGINIRSGMKGDIKENNIDNFLIWMVVNDASESITCSSNLVDNNVHQDCQFGELDQYLNQINDESIVENIENVVSMNNKSSVSNNSVNNMVLIIQLVIGAMIVTAIVRRKYFKFVIP